MRHRKLTTRMLGALIAAGLLSVTVAQGGKPAPPGNGGGDSPSGYQLIRLPDEDDNVDVYGSARGLREVVLDGELAGVEVVGMSGTQAYYWQLDATGVVLTAAPLPSSPSPGVSVAMDISGNGVVVGGGGEVVSDIRPVFWPSLVGDPVPLPLPGAGVTGNAVDINEHGMIVGHLKDNASLTQMAAVWQLTGDETDPVAGPLILTEAARVWAPSLNDAGTVVVTSAYEGFLWNVTWDGTSLTASAAEPLTGVILDQSGDPRDVILRSTGINELGDVCGEYVAVGGGLWGTFLLLSDDTLIDLPTPEGKRFAPRNNGAYDLNDAADPASIEIVGNVHLFDKRSGILTDDMPVVWLGGNVTDLESETAQGRPKLRLSGIDRVSNHGWLCGFGEDPDTSTQYGVVLVPQ